MSRRGADPDPFEMHRPESPLAAWDRAIGWGIFMLALLARAAYLKQLRGSPLWDDLPVDLGYYRDWALRIAAGSSERAELFEQSPLYAWFLAGVFRLFGDGLTAPRLIQIVVGAATCVLIYRTGRLLLSPGSGLAAGLLAALYGPFLFYDGMLMKEVFAVFFVTLALLAIARGSASHRGMLAAAGLFLGLGALVRDNLILVALPVAAWLLVEPWLAATPGRTTARARDGLERSAAFAIGLLLVVGPVTARNYRVSGEFVPLTTGAGEVFYIGNNPAADGRYAPPPFVRAAAAVEHEDFRLEAARRLGRPPGTVSRKESSDYWLDQGLGWIRAHPGDFAILVLRKLSLFWNHYELPDNHSYDHHRRLMPILSLPLPVFGLIAPLAAAGIVLSADRWRRLMPLYVLGAGYLASVMLFFVFGRFRLPIVPVLLVFGGHAVAAAGAALLPATRPRRLARLSLAAAVAVAAWLFVAIDREDDPVHVGQSRGRLAELLLRAGRLQEADAESAAALRLVDRFRAQAGPAVESNATFRAVNEEIRATRVRVASARAGAILERAESLHHEGRPADAMAAVREALAVAPDLPAEVRASAHYGMALIHRDLGDRDAMQRELAECLRLDPSHPRADWIRSTLRAP
ncbi:MAG TPA: glycosyltransferase family 39 protein [Candidatus Polarisedimenticolia bacterium]|nr:glycosyltransferase family 39 protein [Candidatus Polarisedimenticolia bacterium]